MTTDLHFNIKIRDKYFFVSLLNEIPVVVCHEVWIPIFVISTLTKLFFSFGFESDHLDWKKYVTNFFKPRSENANECKSLKSLEFIHY